MSLLVFFSHTLTNLPFLKILPKLLSIVIRSSDNDAQPAAQLPGHDGCAAAPKPWSTQFPEGRNGGTDAKHNGPVPTDAVLSGMNGFQSALGYDLLRRQMLFLIM